MTKVVQLSDEAYDRLRALKHPGESFSAVVMRLVGRGDIRRLKGIRGEAEIAEAEATTAEIDARDR